MGSQGQQGYSPATGTSQSAPAAPAAPQSGQPMQMPQEMPQNFTGYESFSGGQNPFFPGCGIGSNNDHRRKRAHMK